MREFVGVEKMSEINFIPERIAALILAFFFFLWVEAKIPDFILFMFIDITFKWL